MQRSDIKSDDLIPNVITVDLEHDIDKFYKDVGSTIRSILQYRDQHHVFTDLIHRHKDLLPRIHKKIKTLKSKPIHKKDLEIEQKKLEQFEIYLPLIENALEFVSRDSVKIPPNPKTNLGNQHTMREISEWCNRLLDNLSYTLLHPERVDAEMLNIEIVYHSVQDKIKSLHDLDNYEKVSEEDTMNELQNRAMTLEFLYVFLQYFKNNVLAKQQGIFERNNINIPVVMARVQGKRMKSTKKMLGNKVKSCKRFARK